MNHLDNVRGNKWNYIVAEQLGGIKRGPEKGERIHGELPTSPPGVVSCSLFFVIMLFSKHPQYKHV